MKKSKKSNDDLIEIDKRILFLIIIVVMSVAGFSLTLYKTSSFKSISFGDIVSFSYYATLENESYVDSGNVTITIGSGEIIPGVEKALIGMKKGEKKHFVVQPEDAYGNYDKSLIYPYRKYFTINRTFELTLEILKNNTNETIAVGKKVTLRGLEWPVIILKIKNNTVLLKNDPVLNSLYYPLLYPFPIKIIKITPTNITIENIGKVGSTVRIGLRFARVIEVKNDSIILDFNYPLAGKTLVFDIKILDVKKQSK